ncbi:MAG: ThuA domain-containing protein [Promethearchaeota archaeon]
MKIIKRILLLQRGRYLFRDKINASFRNILSDYIVDKYEDTKIFSDRDFFEYDTTIFFTQFDEITDVQEKNVLDFVASGKGFVGIHGASASFKAHPKYYEMLGGRFIGHKKVKDYHVKIVDKSHPITQGLEDFIIKEEQYQHDLSMGENIHILAEADYHDEVDPKSNPIMWTKTYGKGRIFFCALGHKSKSLEEEILQIVIKRAVKWVLEEHQES